MKLEYRHPGWNGIDVRCNSSGNSLARSQGQSLSRRRSDPVALVVRYQSAVQQMDGSGFALESGGFVLLDRGVLESNFGLHRAGYRPDTQGSTH